MDINAVLVDESYPSLTPLTPLTPSLTLSLQKQLEEKIEGLEIMIQKIKTESDLELKELKGKLEMAETKIGSLLKEVCTMYRSGTIAQSSFIIF